MLAHTKGNTIAHTKYTIKKRTEPIELVRAATKTTGSDAHMVLLPAAQLWLKRSL